MSTVFYIVDQNKQKEYENYCKFLEEQKELLTNNLLNYAKSVNGALINEDRVSYETDYNVSQFFDSMKYSIDTDDIRFGQVSARGFSFFMDHTCSFIRDVNDVKKYLDEHEGCIIMDECYDMYSFEDFKKIVERGYID